MRAVFLDQQTFNNQISLAQIEAQTSSMTCYQTTQPTEILARCLTADIIISNKVILNTEILTKLPKLKLICIAATGTNNVDIAAATALGIAVTNVSGYANNSVAQYVFSQILAYYSQIHHHNNNTSSGLWQSSTTFCYHGNGSTELSGKTLGIIGYGSLGQSVAKIATAFDMKVLVAERKNSDLIRNNRVGYDEVIKNSDIISLHCPQNSETEHSVNNDFLGKMKKSAMLINTARGALVDNQALFEALKNETIAYAVLDVLEQEPPPKNHLLLNAKLDNLKITAHIAWASFEAQQQLIELIAENISAFKQGKDLNRVTSA